MSRRKAKKIPTAASKVPGQIQLGNPADRSKDWPIDRQVRNPVAANPLLGKSQAHGKTRKANRRADKVSLSKMSFERIACRASETSQRFGQALGSNDISTGVNTMSAETCAAALTHRLAA